jgi:predicted branched-subunit amino acid permease
MTVSDKARPGPPFCSLKGANLGARLALPVAPAMIAFGLAVGAAAAAKGLALIDSVLMNGLVYAGASQLVALEIWPQQFTFGAIASLAVVCAIVNARMLLITASLYPWLGPLPPWQIYPVLYLVTDPGWLIAMRYRTEGGSDAGVLLGSSVMLWLIWMAASTGGYLIGTLIADPRQFGIDLVMPLFFTALLVPLWRGGRRALAWAVAGAVALAVQHIVGGYWYIVAGALAGSVAGGFLDE